MTEDTRKLMTDNPTPLSSRFGWPLLTERKPNVDLKGIGATPFSDRFNLPLLTGSRGSSDTALTDNPTPFSSRLGLPLLSQRRSDIELPTDNPTPLSSRLGLPLLTSRGSNIELLTGNPTPLSSALGLPLLSGERATGSASQRTGGGSGTDGGNGPVARFLRQIVTGEVQK